MKRGKKRIDKSTEARRRAREAGLVPSTTRVIGDKRLRPPKHKRDPLGDDERL
jgi:hypothetical protein